MLPSAPRSVLHAITLLAISMLALTACSSDDDGGGATPGGGGTPAQAAPDAETYATSMCTSITDWVTAIQQGNTELQESLQGETDPAAVKDRLSMFLSGAVDSSDTMLEEVRAVGAPDVDGGDEVHEELVNALDQARAALEDARSTLDDLDAGNPAELGQGMQQLGTSLQTAFSGIVNPLETLQNEELDQAFADSDACAELEQMAA